MRFIFYISFFICCALQAQSFAPIITKYSKTEYSGESPIWDIAENKNNGTIYFANNRNILAFDGNFWEKISTNNLAITRSVAIINNVIYSGSLKDFGYWKTENGHYKYHSISKKFNSFKNLEQEEIWKIFYHQKKIYFQSFNYLFQFDGEEVKRFKLPSLSSYIFDVNGQLFLTTISQGIYEFKNNQFVKKFNVIKDKSIVVHGLEKYQNTFFIGTLTEGIFTYNSNNEIKLFDPDFNRLLKNHMILKMIRYEHFLIIGTSNNGVYVYDLNNKTYKNYNQNLGLISNTIQNIKIDSKGNAWIGTDKGISKIELKSKTQLLYDYNGHLGNVFTFDFYQNNLLIGTNHGFYNYSFTDNSTKPLVEKGLIWNVTNIDNTLYVSDSWGTHLYNNNLEKISLNNGGYKLIKLADDFYQSTFTGVFKFDQNTLKSPKKISKLSVPILDFVVVNNKILGIGKNGGLFLFDITKSSGREILFDGKQLINPQIIKEKDKIYILIDNQKLVHFDTTQEQFSDQQLLSKLKNINRIRQLDSDNFLLEADNILYYSKVENNKLIHYLIPKKLYDGKLVDDNLIGKLNDHFLYINLENGILKYDLNSIRVKPPKVKISAKINQITLGDNPKIEYSNNYIDFFVSILNDDFSNYQLFYQLNDSKIQPLNSPIINYKQLESGSYTLSIYTLKDGNFEKLNYNNFTVKKIWYLSNLMMLLYFVIVTGSIVLFYQYNRMKIRQRFKLKQKEFEYELNFVEMNHQQELKELNYKKEKQLLEHSLQSKSTELAGQALKLANQRALISDVNELFSHLDDNEENKRIKKKFEKTFSEYSYNKSEWQHFELNIQEIHHDFIKKLSEKYPQLTAKDLKLCVFLRMNLSTKEIAPLMHLNYRSVELQRYRLRKKMNISSEINLNKYMINF